MDQRALQHQTYVVPLILSGAAFLYLWDFLIQNSAPEACDTTLVKLVVLLVAGAFWRPLSDDRHDKAISVCWCALALIGTWCVYCTEELFSFQHELGMAMVGGLSAFGLLMWCKVYGSLPAKKTVFCFGQMQCVTMVLCMAAAFISVSFFPGLALAAPVLSQISFMEAQRIVKTETFEKPAPMVEPSFGRHFRPWLIVAAFFCAAACGACRVGGSVEANVVAFGLAGIVLLITVFASRRTSIYRLFLIALPLLIGGMIALAAFGAGGSLFSGVVTNAGYALAMVLFTVLMADQSFRFGIPVVWSMAFVRLSLMAGMVLGLNLPGVLESADPDIDASALAIFATTVAVVVSALAWVFNDGIKLNELSVDAGKVPGNEEPARGERPSADGMGGVEIEASSEEPAEADSLAQGAASGVESYKRAIAQRAIDLADEYHLTVREREVVNYIALGWSVPRISAEMVVSDSTVKTHVKHAYSKLGTHSRDELRMLFGIDSLEG